MEEIKNQSRLINKLLLLYRLPNNPDGNIFSFKQEAAETTIQQSIIDALTSEKRTKEKKRNRNR